MDLKKEVKEEFIRFQRNEKTESIVYERLASIEKDESNRKVLRLISAEEKAHYATLKKYTETDVAPDKLRIAKYYWLARILGITFAIKLMESSEENAHHDYAKYTDYPDLRQLANEEEVHEQQRAVDCRTGSQSSEYNHLLASGRDIPDANAGLPQTFSPSVPRQTLPDGSG